MSERELSVVVFGATGITGLGAAAHLAGRAEEAGFAWAAAGRDPDRVTETLANLGVSAPEIITAAVGDPTSLAAMASRTRVLIDLVGPYTLYGGPVIEACIAAGTHYIDLSGEIPFVRAMIERFGEAATAAKIVNVSGFEALPADLGVLLVAETARQRWSEELAAVDLDAEITPPPGGAGAAEMISGGTLQSIAEILGAEGAAAITDPAALIADPALAERVRKASPIAIAPRFSADGEVIGPMAPAAYINPAVIHRTAALIAAEEGRELRPFRYREGIAIPGAPATLPLRYAAAGLMAGTQALTRALAGAGPSLRGRLAGLLRRTLPASGFGPKGERMELWSWRMVINARTEGGHYLRVEVDGEGHPGYLTTARMVAEAGLLLAEDGATPPRSGFLTPAAALGSAAAERFRLAGVRFWVSS